jgi:hypothetical protein
VDPRARLDDVENHDGKHTKTNPHEKLMVAKLVKKFCLIYATRRLIIAFKRDDN